MIVLAVSNWTVMTNSGASSATDMSYRVPTMIHTKFSLSTAGVNTHDFHFTIYVHMIVYVSNGIET